MTQFDDTAVFIGAGFSHATGLPLTSTISRDFIDGQPPCPVPIREILKDYWTKVFGYQDGTSELPSFEDHFTVLDLAANTGHNLGPDLTPAKLRAIRRISIHRVFEIINYPYQQLVEMGEFLRALAKGDGNVLISTNWDVVPEQILASSGRDYSFEYGQAITSPVAKKTHHLSIRKLHGSANWAYCDTCRKVEASSVTKTLYDRDVLMNREDLLLLGASELEACHLTANQNYNCRCGARMSARIATFSYAKSLDFFQFQSVWDNARKKLIRCRDWIFIGYSLPDADFHIRQLLKTAELASHQTQPFIRVVTAQDPEVITRYRRFFGSHIDEIHDAGFQAWWAQL